MAVPVPKVINSRDLELWQFVCNACLWGLHQVDYAKNICLWCWSPQFNVGNSESLLALGYTFNILLSAEFLRQRNHLTGMLGFTQGQDISVWLVNQMRWMWQSREGSSVVSGWLAAGGAILSHIRKRKWSRRKILPEMFSAKHFSIKASASWQTDSEMHLGISLM